MLFHCNPSTITKEQSMTTTTKTVTKTFTEPITENDN